MTGKTHIGMGIVAYVGACSTIPGGFNYTGAAVVAIASLLPDIDHPKGILNQYILPFKNNATKVAVYTSIGMVILTLDFLYFNNIFLKVLGFILIMIAFSSHREGITHSLMGMILFAVIISYVGKHYEIANIIYYFLIGYGMHIIGDMFTKRGVPVFYPFNKKKYKFPVTFVTGSPKGKIIEEFIMIAGLMYIIYKLPSILM
ncbi:metal-dependent hydrolase [Haloimpatiens sp. FM7315]|uniref:metal-dependent hydrolase n=1 Tax=Haloimpatiens sp. FM7315 TaxID=3298609 RepID=UPI0035A28F90